MMRTIQKRFHKRLFALFTLFILAASLLSTGNSKLEAATGTWKKNAVGYWFSYSDGSYAKNTWLQWNKKWYHFNANGYMQTGWIKVGTKWYYLEKQTGAMRTGWIQVSGKWYFLNTNGVMQVGWKQITGKWYYFDGSGIMQTGWKQLGGKWYYMDSTGCMVTGTRTIGGVQYTFDNNGALITTDYKVGDTIKFGHYEQDNNTSNGKEAIDWTILAKASDGSILILSKYALDCQPFNKTLEINNDWEHCSLRGWLNSSFYNAAFSASEQKKIQSTKLSTKNYASDTTTCTTTDQVFLLDLQQVKKYFPADTTEETSFNRPFYSKSLYCEPTKYARARGAIPEWAAGEKYCQWMIRTVASYDALFAKDNAIWYDENTVTTPEAVRPALWIKPN